MKAKNGYEENYAKLSILLEMWRLWGKVDEDDNASGTGDAKKVG